MSLRQSKLRYMKGFSVRPGQRVSVQRIYDMIKDGIPFTTIQEQFCARYGYDETTVKNYYQQALYRINEENYREFDLILGKHSKRYDDLFYKNYKYYPPKTNKQGKPRPKHVVAKERTNALKNAMKALKHKEKLYGLRTKHINIAIENKTYEKKQKSSKDKYDFSQLSIDERKELFELLGKAQQQDYEEAQVVEEAPKQIKEQSTSANQDMYYVEDTMSSVQEEQKEDQPRNIIDARDVKQDEEGKSEKTVADALKEAIRKEAEEKFKNKS